MSSDKPGLRERKKAKTRAALQHHALRLIRERGYANTTVEQIAEAAEISPSTFFRYFPTKESVILDDDFDPILIEAFLRQPRELTPVRALRASIREGRELIPPEEQKALRDRVELILAVPELRTASFNHIADTLHLMARMAAERAGRDSSEQATLAFAGAAMGVVLSAQMYCLQHPETEFLDAVDDSLGFLEAGLPL